MSSRKNPIEIHKVPYVDYFLFLDESGDSAIKNFDSSNPVFTLCGVMIQANEYVASLRRINAFKESYWKSGSYFKDGFHPEKVTFNSRDIRRRRGAFSRQNFDDQVFDGMVRELWGMIPGLPFELICAGVDKKSLVSKGLYANSGYEPALEFILERFSEILNSRKKRGIVVLRSRGTKEDALLSELFLRFFNNGTARVSHKILRRTVKSELYFVRRNSMCKENEDTFVGLEIANLCAYPVSNYVPKGEKSKSFRYLESKFAGFPYYEQKGLKVFE